MINSETHSPDMFQRQMEYFFFFVIHHHNEHFCPATTNHFEFRMSMHHHAHASDNDFRLSAPRLRNRQAFTVFHAPYRQEQANVRDNKQCVQTGIHHHNRGNFTIHCSHSKKKEHFCSTLRHSLSTAINVLFFLQAFLPRISLTISFRTDPERSIPRQAACCS